MSLLNNAKLQNLGTTVQTVYTVPVGKNSVLIGGNIANKITDVITVDISIIAKSDAKEYFILKGLTIPQGASFSFSGSEQKIVLSPEDKVNVKSSANNSSDVWLSFSEMGV